MSRALAILLLVGLAAPAAAEGRVYELEYELKVDLPVTLVAVTVLGTSEALKGPFGPATCRWCDTRESLNAFDRSAIETTGIANRPAAALASDVFAYGVIPAFALGLDLLSNYQNRGRPGRHWAKRFAIDVLLIVESTSTALATFQAAKFGAARRRPLAIDRPIDEVRDPDDNLSFFSGHSTLAFVIATTMATELSLRRHRLAPVAWALGMAMATSVAMLRVAGDRHFATDVIMGSLVGSTIGVIVPLAHRGRMPVRLGGSADATGGVLSVSGRF